MLNRTESNLYQNTIAQLIQEVGLKVKNMKMQGHVLIQLQRHFGPIVYNPHVEI